MDFDKLPRNASGELEPYAWPGGYTILYLDGENNVLCHKCAVESECARDEPENEWMREEDGGWWTVVAAFIHWEGPSEWCDDCSAELSSEYGDPWDESDDEGESA